MVGEDSGLGSRISCLVQFGVPGLLLRGVKRRNSAAAGPW